MDHPQQSFDDQNPPQDDSTCQLCNRPTRGAYYKMDQHTVCPSCAGQLVAARREYQATSSQWLAGLGYGLAGAVGGAIAWALVTKYSHAEWGILAVLIAIGVCKAVLYGTMGRRGRSVQVLTIGLSVLGIYLGKGLIAAWVWWPQLVAGGHVDDTLLNRVAIFLLAPISAGQLYDLLWYLIAVWEGWRMGRLPRLRLEGPYQGGADDEVIGLRSVSPEALLPSVHNSVEPAPAGRSTGSGNDRMRQIYITLLKTVGSMIVSVAVYWLFLGWQFAIGLVLLIFVHEMGHVVALRYYKLNASPPIFIPFLGALINLRQQPQDAKVEAIVGIGGPVLGTVGAVAAFAWYLTTKSELALQISYFGFFLNLFNMIPMPPLDGGRVTAAISPWFWILGLVALGAMVFDDIQRGRDASILILILLVSLPRVIMTLTNKQHRSGPYYNISKRASWSIGIAYILLLGILGILMWYTGRMIHPFG